MVVQVELVDLEGLFTRPVRHDNNVCVPGADATN